MVLVPVAVLIQVDAARDEGPSWLVGHRSPQVFAAKSA